MVTTLLLSHLGALVVGAMVLHLATPVPSTDPYYI